MKSLTLTVKDGEDREITSTMRKTDKLQDLMDLYYEMVPVFSPDEGTFLCLGKPVDGRKTPKGYKMGDMDDLDFSYGIDSSNLVALTVREEETGLTFTRTLRKTDDLEDLMDFYYDMVRTVDRGDGVFLFNGRRVRGDKTPKELGLEDGDEIEVYLQSS